MIANMSTPPKDWDARKGGIVRKRRQALDLDQRDLAERVGVHVNSVQRWEAGRQYPGRHLGKLEAVLGIVIDSGEPEPGPAIPQSLLSFIVNTKDLTEEQRVAVIAAVDEALARERGETAPSSSQAAAGRHRPAS